MANDKKNKAIPELLSDQSWRNSDLDKRFFEPTYSGAMSSIEASLFSCI